MSTEVPMESSNTPATHVARADCPRLSDPEWEALQRLSTSSDSYDAAYAIANGATWCCSRIHHEGAARCCLLSGGVVRDDTACSIIKIEPKQLRRKRGRASPPMACRARHSHSGSTNRRPVVKGWFDMSCLGGQARSWTYGRRLSDPTCFSTYEIFKEEIRQAFEPRKMSSGRGRNSSTLQQGKHDVHAYAQRARYLVSNIVTNPIDEATKVVTFMKGLRDGPVKTYLFREYPSTLEGGRRGDARHRRGPTKKREHPVGAGRPTGNAVARADIGHATLRTAAPQ
ncbi:hypothetical protein ON010_g5859 [Phytophthora cinnamomi]|nr:hypothetical protein ON010_g5859 [Phytophthora cinnamomi]